MPSDITNLKQPKSLYLLFFAEFWERFGFYIIQALLVIYLTKHFQWSDKQAYGLLSAYSALVYASPVIGGFIADRFLGYRRAIFLGSFFYIIGYFGLATLNLNVSLVALACLITGNGLFKSSVSSLLGTQYEHNDPRRESGFTIFYMGINLGVTISPLLCTYLALHYGWTWAYIPAGLGMCIGAIACYYKFEPLLNGKGNPPKPELLSASSRIGVPYIKLLYIGSILFLIANTVLLHYNYIANWGLIIFASVIFLYLGFTLNKFPKVTQRKLLVLLIVTAISILSWALYMQMFLSITLFAERSVNRHIFNVEIPTSMYASVEAIFIILLAPLFAQMWLKLASTRWEPSIPLKFAYGLIFISFSYVILLIGMHFKDSHGLMSMWWLVFGYFFIACGELSFSPIGLAAVTELSPQSLTGMMMGVWFLALSAAYAIAGQIADSTSIPRGLTDPLKIDAIYTHAFTEWAIWGLILGFILLACTPILKRMMRD